MAKIKLTRTDEGLPVNAAWDEKARKGVELEIQGGPGKWYVETESLHVAADLAINRGWTVAGKGEIAFPVIPNGLGLFHPKQFIFECGVGLKPFDPCIPEAAPEAVVDDSKAEDGAGDEGKD